MFAGEINRLLSDAHSDVIVRALPHVGKTTGGNGIATDSGEITGMMYEGGRIVQRLKMAYNLRRHRRDVSSVTEVALRTLVSVS